MINQSAQTAAQTITAAGQPCHNDLQQIVAITSAQNALWQLLITMAKTADGSAISEWEIGDFLSLLEATIELLNRYLCTGELDF